MPDRPPLVLQPPTRETAQKIADTLRFLAADQVQQANSGHPGMPMGSAEIATVLMTKHLRIDPKDDKWLNRDRFVLSAGHASALLYAMLHLQGFLTIEDLQAFRQLDSRTPGHPEAVKSAATTAIAAKSWRNRRCMVKPFRKAHTRARSISSDCPRLRT